MKSLGFHSATVRQHLEYLRLKRLLERRYGSARLVSEPVSGLPERDFQEKGGIDVAEKKAITEKALEFLNDDEICFINSGSTALFLIENLRGRPP